MSEATLISKFLAGVANMAAFSREVGIPTEAGMPHMFGNAFRNVAALCSSLDFTFKEIEDVKKLLENPDAFVAAAGPATGGGGGGGEGRCRRGGGGGGGGLRPLRLSRRLHGARTRKDAESRLARSRCIELLAR